MARSLRFQNLVYSLYQHEVLDGARRPTVRAVPSSAPGSMGKSSCRVSHAADHAMHPGLAWPDLCANRVQAGHLKNPGPIGLCLDDVASSVLDPNSGPVARNLYPDIFVPLLETNLDRPCRYAPPALDHRPSRVLAFDPSSGEGWHQAHEVLDEALLARSHHPALRDPAHAETTVLAHRYYPVPQARARARTGLDRHPTRLQPGRSLPLPPTIRPLL